MTHTSTEQPELPEALRLAEMLTSGAAMIPEIDLPEAAAELRRLHARVQELEAERDEADRRAGAAERELSRCKEDLSRIARVRREMKQQWGVSDNVSFDVVWKEALTLKASKARVPLATYQRDTIKANAWRETPMGGYYDANAIIDGTEAAHGITQEKQG